MNLKHKLYQDCIRFYVMLARSLKIRQRCLNINLNEINKILIIHPQRIGDFIVATPIIRALKKKMPNAGISFLASPDSKEMAENHPSINQIFVFDEEKAHWITLLLLFKKLKKERFDLVLNCQTGFTTFKRAALPLVGTKYRIGFKRGGFIDLFATHPVEMPAKHVVEQFSALLCPLDIDNTNLKLEVFYSKKHKKEVALLLSAYDIWPKDMVIVIHPGNKNPLKRWKSEYFAKVADYLAKNKKAKIIFTGSCDEEGLVIDIQNYMKYKSINLAGKTTILQLCALIGRANLLLSIDTASVHIASATNTPTVAIYGPTETYYWGAWNKKNQRTVEIWPPCKLCEDNDFKRITHPIKCSQKENMCMTGIKPERVIGEINSLLGK